MTEIQVRTRSGWGILLWAILAWIAVPGVIIGATMTNLGSPGAVLGLVIGIIVMVLVALFLTLGFFTLQPNEARALILFGAYKGTERESGFHWTNPFRLKRGSPTVTKDEKGQPRTQWRNKSKVSLRARNFETGRLKVNDLSGNPIEIAAVVVWHISDTAQAIFDVDDYEDYVSVQSESALRHVTSSFPYDDGEAEEGQVTLRQGADVVCEALQRELQERLSKAGVVVDEARLTHLAYAPEIAGAMLRRQQAEAIIAARQKIVHGAVSMVQMALEELALKNVVELDEERKAAMVGNLLVILCGETEAQPIINAGTLYH